MSSEDDSDGTLSSSSEEDSDGRPQELPSSEEEDDDGPHELPSSEEEDDRPQDLPGAVASPIKSYDSHTVSSLGKR